MGENIPIKILNETKGWLDIVLFNATFWPLFERITAIILFKQDI